MALPVAPLSTREEALDSARNGDKGPCGECPSGQFLELVEMIVGVDWGEPWRGERDFQKSYQKKIDRYAGVRTVLPFHFQLQYRGHLAPSSLFPRSHCISHGQPAAQAVRVIAEKSAPVVSGAPCKFCISVVNSGRIRWCQDGGFPLADTSMPIAVRVEGELYSSFFLWSYSQAIQWQAGG